MKDKYVLAINMWIPLLSLVVYVMLITIFSLIGTALFFGALTIERMALSLVMLTIAWFIFAQRAFKSIGKIKTRFSAMLHIGVMFIFLAPFLDALIYQAYSFLPSWINIQVWAAAFFVFGFFINSWQFLKENNKQMRVNKSL